MNAKVETLLIEDDEASLDAISEFLSTSPNLKYIVTTAESFEEAKEKLAANYYDLILLDLTLSDAGGVKLIREIRHLAHLTAIVVITGDASEDTQIKALSEGVQEYFIKGQVEASEILRRLRRVVTSHRGYMARLFGPVDKAIADGYKQIMESRRR